MFWSLAWAMAILVNDGVFFLRGLYSGSLTNGDFLLVLFSFVLGSTWGRVKITVFSFRFTSLMFQPMFCHALNCTDLVFVHHSVVLWAAAGRSFPIRPSISENWSLSHRFHWAFLDKNRVRGVYLPLKADALGVTYLRAQFRQIRYSPSRRSSVMQLLQYSCLQRGHRVSCEGETVRLQSLHWLSGSGGRVPPIGIIISRTRASPPA